MLLASTPIQAEIDRLIKEHSKSVHLLLSVYKQGGRSDSVALYYPVQAHSDTFNCYLKPNTATMKIDIVCCRTTGLSPEREEDLSRNYLYFTNNPVTSVMVEADGEDDVDGPGKDFHLDSPPPHRN